jgi:pyruvate/2-oxoglutarate dehydrogenase complex dihydrolipoamide dehydrogenase (E3) component
MTKSFDVVILGGGNAGMGVTVATREAGLAVAMIEPDLLGGTCPNRSCMPKKVLVAAAHVLDEIARAPARSHRGRRAEIGLGGADRPGEGHDPPDPGLS